jgi:MtrB/PioB family decaheme-associated outer membrane protein
MNSRNVLLISVLAAFLFSAGAALADSDGFATFGSQGWWQSAPEAKYREYRDLPRGPLLETFALRDWQDQWAGTLWGRNVIQQDGDYGLSISRGVSYRLDGRYQSIPHLFSLVARSPYSEMASGVFRLPDSLQRVNQEYPATYIANMQSWLSSVPRVPLATGTDISQLRLRSRPAKDWRLELRGSGRQRDGTQAYAGTFGTSNTVELAAPIAQNLLDGDAIASYEHGDVRVQATAGVSEFQNHVNTLIWDNPRRYTDGATNATGSSQGRMALAPDNQVVRGLLAVGWRLPRASVASANLSVSEGTQNDPFIPYTINSALAWSRLDSLPARSLDAKATTVTQDYRLSGSPFRTIWAALRFRNEQYTNKTAKLTFNGLSSTDNTWTADTTQQDLLSWARSAMGADLDFNPARWGSVTLLLERQYRKHNDREVLSDHEDILGGSLRLHPLDEMNLSGRYRHGNRTQDNFDASVYDGGDPNGLRRFDVANRRQDLAQAEVTYGLTTSIDLGSDYSYVNNDYPDTQFGLLHTRDQTVVLDATYHVAANLDLDGGWGGGFSNSQQHGYDSNSKDWYADIHDKNSFVYVRGTWWPISEKFSLIADYNYMWDMVKYDLTGRDKFSAADTTPGNTIGTVAEDPPNTFYRIQQLTLEGRWHGSKNMDVTLRYYYDQYDVDDFSVSGDLPLLGLTTTRTGTTYTTTATSLFLGDELMPYHAHRFAFLLTRRF